MNRQQRRAAAKQGNAQGGSSGQQSGVAELLAAGVRHHQAGQLPEAEKNYRLALELQPDQPDALHLLGVLAIQVGRQDVATELIGRAVRLNAKNPGYHANLGLALQHQGKFDEALKSLDQALALADDHVEALNSRGNVLMKLKRFAEALASYDRLVALKPDLPEAFNNRGIVLKEMDRPEDALSSYDRALALRPDYAEALHNRGNALQKLDRLDEALANFDRALALKPDYADAFHNRGRVLQQLGRLDDALDSYRRAVTLSPALAEAHGNSGAILREMKRFAEALAAFERASALKPDLASAWLSSGIVLVELGQFDKALTSIDRALACEPVLAEGWLNRGNVCGTLGRHEEALAAYHRALDITSDLAGAWVGRGNVLCELERHGEALECYDKALAHESKLASAWLGRGNALLAQKRLGDALAAYDGALALDPDVTGAWLGRGNVFRELTRADDAITAYDEALRRDPDLAEAYLGRGNALSELKRDDDALAAYQMAIAVRPDFAQAWLGRGNVLRETRRFVEALAAYDRALRLKPQLPGLEGARLKAKMQVCDWRDFDAERAQLVASLGQGRIVQPFDLLSISASAGAQYACARSFSERNWPRSGREDIHRPRPAHDRIRLAYMSADFRQHPMSYLMAEIFERHDRSRFEVTAISIGPDDGSPMRRRLEIAFADFIDARTFTDERIAGLIEESGIDILVDLMGYTKGARTAVVARRPAPVQVNYLGFPGTMGTPHIDYVIADRVVIPDAQRAQFSEKIAYLPFSYYPNGREPHGDKTVARADVGLPDGAFVFCCFNNSFKILPDVFDGWMRILSGVAGSVLWLLEDNEMASANLRKEAAARGVAAERLIFAKRATHAEHLARHRCADLFIDTLPYNAHTTALDALWEGVPVLTRAGETFAGRVAASLLTALDLPELIVETLADYERLAVELARQPARLAALKQKLDGNRSTTPMFDTALFTRHIEKAYTMMVERHRAGLAPHDLAVPDR
jgi:predicted O-linked N-acetylglucosamine transferase (SPINDLY family)